MKYTIMFSMGVIMGFCVALTRATPNNLIKRGRPIVIQQDQFICNRVVPLVKR